MAFLKAGAGRLHRDLKLLLRNWQLAVGIALFCLSSVFFVLGIRKGDLMVLYPMISLGYVWALLWARIFFHEPMTRTKFAGLGMILAGIVMLYAGGR
jgi:undecaprenyl phosphate-alpha-L-ara4N flippase subunit ArnE